MSLFTTQSEADKTYLLSPLLASIRDISGETTLEERRLVARQLIILLRDYYVHLPLKRSSLGIDPVQEANILMDEVHLLPSETDFFKRVSGILKRLRDRHTALHLPSPWRDIVVYLPFAIESFFDEHGRHLIVSKIMVDMGEPTFVPGVEITHWNGVPIRRYIEALSWESDGANPFARIAITMRSLTVRPLGYMAQPDEDWVNFTYRTENNQCRGITIPWRVYIPSPSVAATTNVQSSSGTVLSQGVDQNILIVNNTWYDLYSDQGSSANAIASTNIVNNIRYRLVQTPFGEFGYVRIFSFDVPSATEFVDGFANILRQMPQDGVIIDVRANPGGMIPAGEGLLGLFTDQPVSFQSVSFRNTAATRRLGMLPLFSKWKRSFEMQYETGEVFSQGFPLSQENIAPQKMYSGKVALIIDALCYSTTDFFVSGMQDNNLATTIIGVDPVTGAGGANVWSQETLSYFVSQAGGNDVVPMPSNIDINIAVRRSIRIGLNEGLPVEGLGIFANHLYQLTRRDTLGQNEDLINFAAEVLANPR
jgi:Peptidase family S41